MMRKKSTMKRKAKNKIVRKVKPKKVYKYLVRFLFDGDIQKVEVQKEGKNEAFVKMKSLLVKNMIPNRIFKKTMEHCLCDTIEEANVLYKEYLYTRIVYHKQAIKKINNKIKGVKNEKRSC